MTLPFPIQDNHGKDQDRDTDRNILIPASWDQLITSPPLGHVPWPYTDAEFTVICDLLRKPLDEQVSDRVLLETRIYIWAFIRRLKTPHLPNARRELSSLSDALKQVKSAVINLSKESREYLRAKHEPGMEPIFLSKFIAVVEHFEHQHRFAFLNPPSGKKGGPRKKPHEQRLYRSITNAFRLAYDGSTRTGLPEFRDACLGPLRVRFGLPNIADASDKLRVRRRSNSRKPR
jgi:hypothetical protein